MGTVTRTKGPAVIDEYSPSPMTYMRTKSSQWQRFLQEEICAGLEPPCTDGLPAVRLLLLCHDPRSGAPIHRMASAARGSACYDRTHLVRFRTYEQYAPRHQHVKELVDAQVLCVK
jgi:hypothetical protein